MSKLFPNYEIDLENGIILNTKVDKFNHHSKGRGGYYYCCIKDIYGNNYTAIHQVIIAEGLQLPKHLWPVDENGVRYIVDHIIPVKNGGTNEFKNLHLIPKSDNPKNAYSRMNYSKAVKGENNPNYNHKWTEKEKYCASLLKKNDKKNMEMVLEWNKNKRKSLIQVLPNGEVQEWESTREVGRSGNYCQSNVAAACRGFNNHFYKKSYWYYR